MNGCVHSSPQVLTAGKGCFPCSKEKSCPPLASLGHLEEISPLWILLLLISELCGEEASSSHMEKCVARKEIGWVELSPLENILTRALKMVQGFGQHLALFPNLYGYGSGGEL